jgi:hypothetical protein
MWALFLANWAELYEIFGHALRENCAVSYCHDKVRELIAVKVLLITSLLNISVVAFKVLPLGGYAPMPASSPPFKTILEIVL